MINTDTFSKLQDRFSLKAEASRWMAECQRTIALSGTVPGQVTPQYGQLVKDAKSLGCFLWMISRSGPRPMQSEHFEMIAACFDTLAEAVGLAGFAIENFGEASDQAKASLGLLAEAQSALRLAVAECGGYSDVDQQTIYDLLLKFTSERQVFLKAGMKLLDPIDPTEWASITGRIFALGEEFDKQLQRRVRATLLGRRKHKKAHAVSVSPVSSDVQAVAKHLRGKSLLMIGADGDRLEAKEAIEKAFGLKELIWNGTSSHDSFRSFEQQIARKDVAAVLLLLRWASHSFGDVKAICDRHGKPLIKLQGGYNPNQIASAILRQASNRLKRGKSKQRKPQSLPKTSE